MNINIQFICDTCKTTIDCRFGMSNRKIQPFQFSCPNCEEIIIALFEGMNGTDLTGASVVREFEGLFDGSNPFVDLHLDFPVTPGPYQMGDTVFMRQSRKMGVVNYQEFKDKIERLNSFLNIKREFDSLIVQYKRGSYDLFDEACKKVLGFGLKSKRFEDVLAALYSATTMISSPFTVIESGKQLSEVLPQVLKVLHENHKEKVEELFVEVLDSDYLKGLHYDCLSLYPRMLSLDLAFRPAIYYDYVDLENMGNVAARVSSSNFDEYSNLYKDLAEIFSRQLLLIAGLNNLLKRESYNKFDDAILYNKSGKEIKEFSSLNDFANVDLGRKLEGLDKPFYIVNKNSIDNKLRNSITHYKYEYSESTQLITYYSGKKGMKRGNKYEIYFIEFLRKTLLLFREVHDLNHVIKAFLYFNVFILKKSL